MAGFCLEGKAVSDITETYKKIIWGREEDTSSVFAMGVELFTMTEHTLNLIKIHSSKRCQLKYLHDPQYLSQDIGRQYLGTCSAPCKHTKGRKHVYLLDGCISRVLHSTWHRMAFSTSFFMTKKHI